MSSPVTVTISGSSDDVVCLDSKAIRLAEDAEIYVLNGQGASILVGDHDPALDPAFLESHPGTELEIAFGPHEETWTIQIHKRGTATITHELADGPDEPCYSDHVTLTGDLRYIVVLGATGDLPAGGRRIELS